MPQEFCRLARLFTALAGFTLLAACGGGGGSNPGLGGGGGGGGGGGATITVSGRITFDRLQFNAALNSGLNGAAPVESPAREVVVEAVTGGAAVASTTTDSNGDYSFTVPANSTVFIRARAQMVKTGTAPTWSFTVRNNANSDAIYALDGDSFSTGTSSVTRNLRATSGWSGSDYTGTRAAAPFAILDTVYRTKQLILGAAPTAAFPTLNLYWSDENRTLDCPTDGSIPSCQDDEGIPFCPDDGNIGTSFYFSGVGNDDCTPAAPLPEGIYILGNYADGGGDTDEFDAHVIAHEFGHYFEDKFSRSDSIGGGHGLGDRLDLRVAFGEGWGNAFGAMSLGDPQYRDSFGGISDDFGFNLESDSTDNDGWFSEASVGVFLWDVFDNNATPEAGDNVALGFAPIYAVMTEEQVDTPAFTSIFSFASALRDNNSGSSSAIGNLLDSEDIHGTGPFGVGETNDGNVIDALPVYRPVTLGGGGQVYVCNVLTPETFTGLNKLGSTRFLSFENDSARTVVITATGATTDPSQDPAADPDVYVYRLGNEVAVGNSGGPDVPAAARRVETLSTTLQAGTYVIEVFDFELADAGSRPRCMTVSISGN